jgi:non-ribosomal peptide synthetase component F
MHDEIALWIGTQGFTRNDLLATTAETIDGACDANARAALEFCRDWLAGQEDFIVQTSGSTGAPKPITLTRTQMIASAQATAAALSLAAGDPALVCLPTHYIAGRMMLVRGLVVGMPMTLVTPSANPLAAAPAGARFAFTAVVPLQLETLLAADNPTVRSQLAGMKAILVGGGPLSPALTAAAQTCPSPIYHTYGMTETITHIALRRVNGADAGDAFTPLPGVHLRLDDRGCLAICGPMTAGAWVQSNDVVELLADNTFRWLGRSDNVINSGGGQGAGGDGGGRYRAASAPCAAGKALLRGGSARCAPGSGRHVGSGAWGCPGGNRCTAYSAARRLAALRRPTADHSGSALC